MKRITLALVASAAALLAASSVRADTQIRIGVNFGGPDCHPAPRVVVAPAPTVVYAPPPPVVVAAPRGYWQDVQVKTWVPERWVVRHNRWGRAERVCEPGYYTFTTQRVWVETPAPRGHDHGYGYGRDNRYSRHDAPPPPPSYGWRR